MLRVIGKRILYLIPTLIGLSILLFIWVRSLPGGPAIAILGEKATPEAVVTAGDFRLVRGSVKVGGYDPQYRQAPTLDEYSAGTQSS